MQGDSQTKDASDTVCASGEDETGLGQVDGPDEVERPPVEGSEAPLLAKEVT